MNRCSTRYHNATGAHALNQQHLAKAGLLENVEGLVRVLPTVKGVLEDNLPEYPGSKIVQEFRNQ